MFDIINDNDDYEINDETFDYGSADRESIGEGSYRVSNHIEDEAR